jgi:hypothetical protein
MSAFFHNHESRVLDFFVGPLPLCGWANPVVVANAGHVFVKAACDVTLIGW